MIVKVFVRSQIVFRAKISRNDSREISRILKYAVDITRAENTR